MKKPRLTLQAKYITGIAVIVSFTSIVMSTYYYYAIRAREVAELSAKGRSMTINLAHNSETGVLFSDTQHLNLLMKLLAEDSDVVGIEIISADGSTLCELATDSKFLYPLDDERTEVIEDVKEVSGMHTVQHRLRDAGIHLFDFSSPITTRRLTRDREEIGLMFDNGAEFANQGEDVKIGSARVVISSARPFLELQKIQRNIIGITVLVVFTVILITIPLVRITVKPIRELAEVTQRIAAGDLSQRVVATGHDEIGELAVCFNQMAVDLEKYHEELRQHSHTLEEKVRERTRELKSMNEELALANTELRKAQAQLIQAGKMAAMGEFGAGVAHELNQPLAGIKGYAQLLLSMVPEDSPLRPRLVQIDKQASRMNEITQTMWNLARQSKFEYSFIDVRQPIRDSLILINEQFRQHQIGITTDISDDLPNVYGDANQLHQVFLNLLTNAKGAIDENKGGRVKIAAMPVADKRYVQVLLIDTGSGIPPEIIDNIFNPFFTTKAPGKGTGLGLSINFSIIERHNGFIDVYSEESGGTVFAVTLPTEEFAKCSKHEDETETDLVVPCWASAPVSSSNPHTRRADCKTCEIYLRFQSSPATGLATHLKNFLSERSSAALHA